MPVAPTGSIGTLLDLLRQLAADAPAMLTILDVADANAARDAILLQTWPAEPPANYCLVQVSPMTDQPNGTGSYRPVVQGVIIMVFTDRSGETNAADQFMWAQNLIDGMRQFITEQMHQPDRPEQASLTTEPPDRYDDTHERAGSFMAAITFNF